MSVGRKVIVEGVDGAGKSTFIQNYIKEHNDVEWEVIHCTRHTPNTYIYFRNLLRNDKNIIFDRSFVGQWIYQTESDRRERGQLDLSQLNSLCQWSRDLSCEIWYVYSDPEVCLYNCRKDVEDSYYTLDYIKELDIKFRQVLSMLPIDVNYYYNDYHPNSEVKTVSPEEKLKVISEFKYDELPRIYAVDFDGTIAKNAFPDITKAIPNEYLIKFLKEMKNNGIKLILWTNRTDQHLIDACNWCADRGLYFDAVNENIGEVSDPLFGGPRKVYASAYIDDKSVSLRDLGMEF